MSPLPRSLACAIAVVLIVPAPALGQSVSDIVEQMYEAFEQRAEGVDNYTLVQRTMGFETASYFEKEIVDGRPVFRVREGNTEGFSFSLSDEGVGQGDIFLIGPDLIEHGEYAGRDEIDGNPVHVLFVPDLTALELGPPTGSEDMDFEPRSGRIYVDAELMVPRRLEFEGVATTDTGTHDVTMRMNMQDYREVDGLLMAYRTVMEVDGFQAMVDPEMQAQLEEMEAQMANMPEAQRAMMERMMGGQMEKLREAMGGDGPMTVEVEVTEVRVNSGPG